jgi:hypothetical protein
MLKAVTREEAERFGLPGRWLEPGTTVFIPIDLHYPTVSHGPGDLEMTTAFRRPVVPGSYEDNE